MNDNLKPGTNRMGRILGRVAGVTALLALGAVLGVGTDRFLPALPDIGTYRNQSRMGWYLQTSQWQADARTALAAAKYLLTPESDPEAQVLPVMPGPVAVMLESRPPHLANPDGLQANSLSETQHVQRVF